MSTLTVNPQPRSSRLVTGIRVALVIMLFFTAGVGAYIAGVHDAHKQGISAIGQWQARTKTLEAQNHTLMRRMRVMAQLAKDLAGARLAYEAPHNTFNKVGSRTFLAYVHRQNRLTGQAWEGYFKAVGLRPPTVKAHIVTKGSVTTKCGGEIKATSEWAWYCPHDSVPGGGRGGVWLPLGALGPSEANVMFIILHEFGHHVADELWEQLELPTINEEVNNELIADCLAGAAVGAFNVSGFQWSLLRREFDAYIDPEHGTQAQRVQAYNTGRKKSVVGCVERYWSGW